MIYSFYALFMKLNVSVYLHILFKKFETAKLSTYGFVIARVVNGSTPLDIIM